MMNKQFTNETDEKFETRDFHSELLFYPEFRRIEFEKIIWNYSEIRIDLESKTVQIDVHRRCLLRDEGLLRARSSQL